MGYAMVPMALADLIGLDTSLSVNKILYQTFADSKYRLCRLLQQRIEPDIWVV
jgi:3-hydroxybutyryl-CoA dehydrogenase